MNRVEFLNELEHLLSEIPAEERREAIQYYEDYFDDAGIENEERIIRELKSPRDVAKIIITDLNKNGFDGEFTEKGYKSLDEETNEYELLKLNEVSFAKKSVPLERVDGEIIDQTNSYNTDKQSNHRENQGYRTNNQNSTRENQGYRTNNQNNSRDNQGYHTNNQNNSRDNQGYHTNNQGNQRDNQGYYRDDQNQYRKNQSYYTNAQGNPTNNQRYQEDQFREESGNAYNRYQENRYDKQESVRRRKGRSVSEIIIFSLFLLFIGLPIIFPLLCAGFSVLFGVLVTIFALVVGFGCAGAVCAVVGLIVAVVGIAKLFVLPLVGLMFVGGGLLCFGIGLLFLVLTNVLAKAMPALCRGVISICKIPFRGRRAMA